MSENLKRYNELTAMLTALYMDMEASDVSHLEEEALLDKLDEVYDDMTEEERDLIQGQLK